MPEKKTLFASESVEKCSIQNSTHRSFLTLTPDIVLKNIEPSAICDTVTTNGCARRSLKITENDHPNLQVISFQ